MGWAARCSAQQPGTLDSSFAGDGVFHLDTALHLTTGKWEVHDLGNGRYLILQPDYSADVLTGATLIEDTNADTLLYESGPWLIPLIGNSSLSYVEGHIQSTTLADSAWTILRYTLNGTLDTSFADSGSLVIPVQGFDPDDVDTELCWQAPSGNWYCALDRETSTYDQGYIIKTDPLGVLDSTFGTFGKKFIGMETWVKSIRWLSDGSLCVWFRDGTTSPFDPPEDRFLFLDTNGLLLHQASTFWTGWMTTVASSLVIDQHDIAFFSAGGGMTMTRLCRTRIGEPRVCYWDIYHPWEFADYEYTAAYFFASDAFGGVYYTVNPAGFDQPGRWFIARRHNDGSRDLAFGNIQIPFDPSYSLKGGFVQADGKLVAYGSGPGDHVIARYHNIPDPRAKLDLKLFLGGPMDTNSALMHDSLRAQGLLPLQQPYLDSTFQSVNGVGPGMTSTTVLNETGAEAAVDWVWLELLEAADTATVVATRTGLLRRDGTVTSPINHDPIDFSVGAGSYFLRVRHRNHLGVTLSDPIVLSDSIVSVDLSNPATNTFGTDAQKEVNGVRMLWPGDVNHDGLVRYAGAANDRDAVLMAVGGTPPTATTTGYKDADVNMDGIVKYAGAENDRDVILQSIGGGYPTAVRFEQRP